ncbi:MAG: hypothetical protein NC489_30215 [Ruminococcus flavefaciens]|nr:hypothetical protein [Ruminococcus flavefaciens]
MENKYTDLSDIDRFVLARWTYSIGESIMSDADYNLLREVMEVTCPESPYVHRTWSDDPCPVELLTRIGRKDWIATVVLGDKTESIPSLNSDLEVREELQNFFGKGTMSMKHDGWHMQANYYNGKLINMQTRGRTHDAMDANPLCSKVPQEIPVMGKVRVSMEATVSKMNFPFCARTFNNVSERSAVSTILSRPEYSHLIDLHAFDVFGVELEGRCKFDVLQQWGFDVPMWEYVENYTEILQALAHLSESRTAYPSPTDGAVFDGDKRRAIRLLAWEEPIYYSYVTGYFEQYNMYRISPSVTIFPVLRKGSTQRRVNVTNWQRILDYDLEPNSPIAFRVASEAIADFDETATRLCRKEWKGRWDEFAKKVRDDEEIKKCNWQMLVNMP